jgi:hypothetical protein
MRRLVALAALFIVSAAPPPAAPPATCQPAPVIVQTPQMPANSTYVSDGEPPLRYSHPPTHPIIIGFGQANIDNLCGRPPCGKIFLGCTRGDQMALPDPFTTDSLTFARIVRHELSHVNGWPATHGQ